MSADRENEVLSYSHSTDDDTSSDDIVQVAVATRLRKKRNLAKKNSCTILMLSEHLAAYMEERELDRGVEPIKCDKELLEIIFNNYVIVKNIVSHLHWQEKLICKDVGSLWSSAVNRLQQEQLKPVDFSVNLSVRALKKGLKLLKSTEFYTEPMAIFMFCNAVALKVTMPCEDIVQSPCSPACDKDHSIIDMVYHETTAPRDCMYAIKVYSMSYWPVPPSITMDNMIRKPLKGSDEFFCGLYIPKIPGVKFNIINVNCSESMEEDIQAEIEQLTARHTVKGVIACLTDNYLLYVDEQNGQCLEFLHTMQPNTPFAYAGCLVEDTANKAHDLVAVVDSVNKGRDFISGNLMSLGIFLTPKLDDSISSDAATVEPKPNFEVYSFILEPKEWSTLKIEQAIREFSERVPRFEHSVALKFSCMGRQHKHEIEQNSFRLFFPHTRLAGCFGNGELGINHPKRRPRPTIAHKRAREELPYDKVHAYCTIFLYIGWGKITAEAERVD